MTDENYEKKFEEMQKYQPFLSRIIEKLKSNNNLDDDNPRKAQLKKMEMLQGLLTSKEKKLKVETLLKCEGVIKKLYSKMEKNNSPNTSQTDPSLDDSTDRNSETKSIPENVEVVDITGPSSPPASPRAQPAIPSLPVEIPTERCSPLTLDAEHIPKFIKNSPKNTRNTTTIEQEERSKHKYHNKRNSWPNRSSNSSSKKDSPTHTPKVLTNSTSSSSALSGYEHPSDTSLAKGSNKYKWCHPSDLNQGSTSTSKHLSSKDMRTQEHTVPSHNRKFFDPAYTGEQMWNEFSTKRYYDSSSPGRPIPVIDPSKDQKGGKICDKFIYQYKSPNIECSSPDPHEKGIFSRLGAKLENVCRMENFENFSINVKNDRLKATSNKSPQTSTSHLSPNNKISPLLSSIPTNKVAQPPLADVLKSPPLTANDISKLLDETVQCSAFETPPITSTSISGIGTRRPPKPSNPEPIVKTPASSLDFVRKKFALITKNASQFTESPASPPQFQAVNHTNLNERIALKYNPHPRVEHVDKLTATSCDIQKRDVTSANLCNSGLLHEPLKPKAPAPFNVLPTINLSDPRLKKANAVNACLPIISPSRTDLSSTTYLREPVPHSAIRYPVVGQNDPIRPFINEEPLPISPLIGISAVHSSLNYKASSSTAPDAGSPEENWDSDPEVLPKTADAASTSIYSSEQNKTIPTTTTTRPNASKGYSSEENWDSDPETITQNDKQNHPPVNNTTTHKSPYTPNPLQQMSSTIPFSKTDPRLSRNAGSGLFPVPQNIRPNTVGLPSLLTAPVNIPPHAMSIPLFMYNNENNVSQTYNSSRHGLLNLQQPQQQQQQQQLNSCSSRFSALLNDKKERMKYFESKKQKNIAPRTYAEFKEAKARAAAARAAAAKESSYLSSTASAANESKDASRTKDHPKTSHDQPKKSAKLDNDRKSKESKEKECSKLKELAMAKKLPPPDTNLDKLYRGMSFIAGTELPKTITKFKIPRKHSDNRKSESEGETNHANEKCDEVETSDTERKRGSSDNQELKSTEIDRKQEVKIKGQNKKHAAEKCGEKKKNRTKKKKRSNIVGNQELTNANKKAQNKNHATEKCGKVEKLETEKKKASDNVETCKSVDIVINQESINAKGKAENSESSESQKNNEVGSNNIGNKENTKSVEVKETEENEQIRSIDEDVSNTGKILSSPKSSVVSQSRENVNIKNSVEDTAECKFEKNPLEKNSEEEKDQIDVSHSIEAESKTMTNTKDEDDNYRRAFVDQANETNADLSVKDDDTSITSELNASPTKVLTNSVENRSLLSNSSPLFADCFSQPKRILSRRCTMITYGSAPEVDKEKISRENALLFEDLHDHQKLLNKADEIRKRANRKSRNLAEIFQKTDDNCTVSTQNIISGKRRTRTTVNFNEVKQTLAVFKHKKTPAADIKKEIKEGEQMEEEVKPAPAKAKTLSGGNKKGTKKSHKLAKKKVVEEQSCTVSSTSQMGETSDANRTVRGRKILDAIAADSDPSGVEKPINSTTSCDEDHSKQEFLETILQDMNNPNSNHKVLLYLLNQVLSADVFQEVKKLLETRAKDCTEMEHAAVEAADDPEDSENVVTEDQKSAATPKLTEVRSAEIVLEKNKPATVRKKRTNELDRLNHDIRDMFISEGVITATGRRMCTLAAVAEAEQKPENATSKKSEGKITNKKSSAATEDIKDIKDFSHIRIRKSKVVISPINPKLLLRRRSTRETSSDDELNTGNETQEVKPESNAICAEEETQSLPKMPVLKPNTPIKLPEEEKQLESIDERLNTKDSFSLGTSSRKRKLVKVKLNLISKPCPRSKKPSIIKSQSNDDVSCTGTGELDEDSEDDLELSHLRKRLKANNSKELEVNNLEREQNSKEPIPNTNPHWHALSKYSNWCVFCEAKFPHIAIHYKQKHQNSENYSSRIAPTILQQYKQGKLSAPIFGIIRKQQTYWFYRCPFCLQHSRCITRSWFEHFIKHTGEYFFECSKCYKSANKIGPIDAHCRSSCAGGKVVRTEHQTNPRLIKAHICHICNYIQLNRVNLERHYLKQHGCSSEHVTVLGYSINLLNVEGVSIVDEHTANEMQAAAIEKCTQESVVSIDDDDDDDDHDNDNKEKKHLLHFPEPTTAAQRKDNAEEPSNSENETYKVKVNKQEPSLTKIEGHASSVVEEEINIQDKESTVETINTVRRKNISKKYVKLEAAAKEILLSSLGTDDTDGDKNSVNKLTGRIRKSEDTETETETETDSVAKFIVDAQNDVLEAAAKAEAEEKAREAALHSNIFMPTERNNTDSPSIDCLTESLRTIEQTEEQLHQEQQQQSASGSATQGRPLLNTGTSSSPAISMAELLSQRLKDAQVIRSESEEISNALALSQPSANTSICESVSPSGGGNLIIAEDEQNRNECEIERKASRCQENDNDEEDDGNWEDIEISETEPTTLTATSNGKEKSKKKTMYLSRLYATMNSKKNAINKTRKNCANVFGSKKQVQPRSQITIDPNEPNDPLTTLPPTINKMKPMLSNLQDLLPDSPCNDPMELVPELAPVEPLQDLNDLSSILEANFTSLDTQNLLQQMDMNITSDTVCINADGQQQSIQEALEFVSEQQEQDGIDHSDALVGGNYNQTTTVQTTAKVNINQQIIINRVQNLGYSKNAELALATKFYCISQNCSFLYSNESFGLKSHFLTEHPHLKWSGFCNMCNSQVMTPIPDAPPTPESFSIAQEMQHMLEKHVEVQGEQCSVPERLAVVAPEEEEEIASASAAKNDSVPRIKLRRLTGDCLSTTPTSLSTPEPSEVSLPPNDISSQQHNEPSDTSEPSEMTTMNSVPLFKNVSTDFAITSVASSVPATAECLQISNVRSLNENSQTSTNNECTSTLPKISNVCSLNTLVSRRNSPAKGTLWQKQIETDRIQLHGALQDNQEISRIYQNVYTRGSTDSPAAENVGDVFTDAVRDDTDSPTLVAETLPVATATSGDFLITQTISTQYDEGLSNGTNTVPQLGINISIASKTIAPPLERQTSVVSSSIREDALATRPLCAQYKCMGNGCKFQTRVSIAMIEHLQFHERRNFATQREYLRCSLCAHSSDDVDLYIKHALEQHSAQLGVCNSANFPQTNGAGTPKEKVQKNADQADTTSSSSSNNLKDTSQKNRTSNTPTTSTEEAFHKQLAETIKEMVYSTGIPEYKLYSCVIDGCKTRLSESSFHTHIVYHLTTLGTTNVNNYNYKCPHCEVVYHRPTSIKAHIKSHSRHRYFCFQCMKTTAGPPQLLKHFCEKHWKVTNIQTTPLLTVNADVSGLSGYQATQYFLGHGGQKLTPLDIQQFGEKLIAEWQRKKAAAKTHFKPNEANLLPMQPIFQNEVFCSDCLYKTKVRTNMFRHLQLHKISSTTSGGAQLHMASVDPVNPVPCLNSNERHFDKMCNLASSSVVTTGATAASSVKPPFKMPYVYVAETRRFTCGVTGCHYLTISDEIFRSHLSALHQNLTQYSCPFCKEELFTTQRSSTTERILQHLRLHGPKLFQCKECEYLHYMKAVVERHINERHATLRVTLITYERSVDGAGEGTKTTQFVAGKKYREISVTGSAESSSHIASAPLAVSTNSNNTNSTAAVVNPKHKWECDLCKHRTVTHNQMIHHCNVHHGCKQQYQCVHCTFGATQLTHIMGHIDEKHPAKTREARYIFHKIFSNAQEIEANTRPLWQRDDPTRVRHIRGILMEDEEESEKLCKRLRLDCENEEEFEEFVNLKERETQQSLIVNNENGVVTHSNEATAFTENSETEPNLFVFACNHCEYKTHNFNMLKNAHWRAVHNGPAEINKPFYFRLLRILKCALCRSFKGDHYELQAHMKNLHKTSFYVAADARDGCEQVCGYCDFIYGRSEQLVEHYKCIGHGPQDIKNLSPEHLTTILKLGTPDTYVQCMLCLGLFANRMVIVAHAHAKHKHEDNFAFKELQNQIIYSCAVCAFTAVDEMTTMRHMIDHYERFKVCHFCREKQTSFNGYMQHCYTDHRQEIKRFSELYTINDIRVYMQTMRVIFPNGLIMDKKNLEPTSYGNDSHIQMLYTEICKISQEPPIPRLSIARLVARKSIEARQASRNGSPNEIDVGGSQAMASTTAAAFQLATRKLPVISSKISKRRKTVAFGSQNDCDGPGPHESVDDKERDFGVSAPTKKRKISENVFSPTLLSNHAVLPTSADENNPMEKGVEVEEPYSFYGKDSTPIDLSKVYTKVAIGGLDTPLTIDKFRILFKIDAKVLLERLNVDEIEKAQNKTDADKYRHVKRACPASHKFKYA